MMVLVVVVKIVLVVMIVLVVVVDGGGSGCDSDGGYVLFSFISYVFKSSVYFKHYVNRQKNNKKKQLKNVLYCLYPRRTLSYCLRKGNAVLHLCQLFLDSLTSNNPSSLILDVLSGQSLRCRFRILQYWLSGFLSLAHMIYNCSFSYEVLDDQVFCLSDNGILIFIGVNDNLFKLIVSLRLLDALSCVTCQAEYPH